MSLTDSITNAVSHATRDPRRISDAMLYIQEHARTLCLSPSPVHASVTTPTRARLLAIDACYAYTRSPTLPTLDALLSAVLALSCLLPTLDALSPTVPFHYVPGPAPSAPMPRDVCPIALEWSTAPVIGQNPLELYLLGEKYARLLSIACGEKRKLDKRDRSSVSATKRPQRVQPMRTTRVNHLKPVLKLKDSPH